MCRHLKDAKPKAIQLSAALIAVSATGYLNGLYFTFGGYLLWDRIWMAFSLIISVLATTKLKDSKVLALSYFIFTQTIYYASKSLGEAMYFEPKDGELLKLFLLGLNNQL